jgi:hypothetical protein
MREVRVYDGDFPTFEQILAGDPTATFPREIWLQQVQPGEFAVRYKDFKTGLARNPAGKHVKSSEICRIFASVAEARANSREVVNVHWTVRCFIYDHNGAQVDTVSNNRELGKAAAVMYAGILLWLGTFVIVGMGFLWILSELRFLALGRHPSVQGPLFPLGWVGWTAYAIAGLFLGILVWYLRIQFIAKKRVDRLHGKLKSVITPEEKKRFEELNTLHGSQDPADRERFLKLANEYQQKMHEALKK